MRTINFFALLLFLAIASCQRTDTHLAIAYKNFDKEIHIQQNLQFIFNREVAKDREYGVWLDDAYGIFEPAVKGKYKWVSAKELLFSPDSAFAAHTDYRLQFTDLLLKELNDDEIDLGPSMELSFRTPYLRIDKTQTFWEVNANSQTLLVAKIAFNYAVTPEQIRPLLTLHVGGQPVPYMVRSVESPNIFTLAIGSSTPDAWVGKSLSVEIAPGVGLDAKHIGQLQGNANVPNWQKLEILGASSGYVGNDSYIEISTSQSLKAEGIADFVTISPNIPFKIVAKPGGFVMEGNFTANIVPYTVFIKKGLTSVFGKVLEADNSQQAMFGQPAPSIAFAEERGTYLTSQGNRRVGVRIAGMEKVNIRLHKIYENNILQFFSRFGNYSNYYNYEYYVQNFGDKILETKLSVADLEQEAGVQLINLNFIDPNEFKGIYMLELWSENDRWIRTAKLLAISDIGLLAKQGDDEILVFANSIKTSEPISGVNITLVSANNQHVYTLVTNAKGVAKFTDLAKKAPGFKIRVVLNIS